MSIALGFRCVRQISCYVGTYGKLGSSEHCSGTTAYFTQPVCTGGSGCTLGGVQAVQKKCY